MPLPHNLTATPKRLQSLDFMRGLVMTLLALESCALYENLTRATEGSFLSGLMLQFYHHPWHGLRFWDLIQPMFMFMAGVAMAYSLSKQQATGMSWNESFRKTLKRSGWLFFWGVLDYSVRPGGLSFELWDILTQLSFTTLVTFFIFRWNNKAQILFCFGLLLLTEVLYRFTHVPGFDQPFTDQHNFGNYMDTVLMNKINKDGWVAINCIPTAVHTIAGAMIGKLLLSTEKNKLKYMLLASAGCLVLGFGLDIAGVTPIIKHTATSTFTLASLGWALAGLSFCYWWIDLKNHHKNLEFFTIVGMNSLFIYLFFEIVGDRWFEAYFKVITNGLMQVVHVPELLREIISSFCVFAVAWGLCYFLYKKKIFFRA